MGLGTYAAPVPTPDYRSPTWLKANIRQIINFYHPTCMDREFGGYINQLRDDGSVFDRDTKHLVGTCRFIFNFATCAMLFDEPLWREAAEHGLQFLRDAHRQPDGGFAWVMHRDQVRDARRTAYGHAFVLLAAASCTKADIPEARGLIDQVWTLLEQHFWDPSALLYVDEIAAGDWEAISPYRGQNANMHMCEAMIAAFEATRQHHFLDRAELLARRICVDLSADRDGMIWEHYNRDWRPDWNFNRDDPKNLFKPFGYLPGHFLEWTKLLLILDRYLPATWHLQAANNLAQLALQHGWDATRGTFIYAFDQDGAVLDDDRYYWVTSEALAAMALLAMATGDPRWWEWYDRIWVDADRNFIDHAHGGWYRLLDREGRRYDDLKSPAGKTDYHPLAACYEVIRSLS